MIDQKTTEFVLSRPALIYIAQQLGIKYIIGVELDEFKLPAQELRNIINKGKKQLIDQGFLSSRNTRLINSSSLNDLVKTIGFRDLAFVLIREIRGVGKQLFMFNFFDNFIVEHTFPVEGMHRLALISTTEELYKRLGQLLPLSPVYQDGRPEFRISKSAFESALQILKSGDKGSAVLIFKESGLKPDLLERFMSCLELPEFTLSIACFLIKNDKVRNTSSASIFADQHSAWGIWPDNMKIDPPIMLVFPSGITDIYSAVQDWLKARNRGTL